MVKEDIAKTYVLGKYEVLASFDDNILDLEMWKSIGFPSYDVTSIKA